MRPNPELWQQLAGPARCDFGAVAHSFATDSASDGAMVQVSDGTRLRVVGAWPGDREAEDELVIMVGQGVTGLVARNGHAMVLGSDAPRTRVYRRLLGIEHGGQVARLCLPARGLGGQILGVVSVHRGVGRPYGDEDITRLQPCADLLGMRLQVTDLLQAVDTHRGDRDRLIEQAVSAQESERRRIASDLHDGVSTALASMAFHLDAADLSLAKAEVTGGPDAAPLEQARSQIAAARSLGDLAYHQTRAAITGLHSLVLDDLGLVAALETLGQTAPELAVSVTTDPDEHFSDLPDHVGAALFRIAQEVLSNAVRHAEATRVAVSLHRFGPVVVLTVADDGVGFDVRQTPGDRARRAGVEGGHYGLSSIAERCALLGAQLRIDSAPGTGTTVIVELSLQEAPAPTG